MSADEYEATGLHLAHSGCVCFELGELRSRDERLEGVVDGPERQPVGCSELVVEVLQVLAPVVLDLRGAGVPHLDRVGEVQLADLVPGLLPEVGLGVTDQAENRGVVPSGDVPGVLGGQTELLDEVAGELLAGDGAGHGSFLSDG